jgi:transaldolase
MLTQAYRLHALNRNVMIKMPATAEGIEGIRILSAEGISTTATLCFSVAQLVAVAEAAQSGYEQARQHGIDLTGCRSCAALMMGRMEEAPAFQEQAEESGVTLDDAHLRWAGVAVAREAYRIYQERGYETRLLLASMRLGPEVDGSTRIWHLEQVAGGALVLTLFPNILAAFIEAYADQPLEPRIEEPVPPEVLSTLMEVPYFRQAYEEDALAPEQFNDLPGVRITAAGFVEAMETIDAFANR